MNPVPDSAFWLHLLAGLAGETAAALALAALAAWIPRSPAWRRTLWQAAFVALGLIVVAELTGAGRHLIQRVIARPQPTRHFIVRGNLPVPGAPGQPADIAADPVGALPPWEATAVPAPPPARWWPGGLWLAGSGLLLARFVAARVLLLVAGGRRRRVADDALRGQVERIGRRLGVRRRVRLLEFKALRSPIAFGVLRPAIGLPARFRDAFPPAQREAMLAHEVAHLAARDPLWHGLAEVVTAALWWQPLVWWARRQLHAASESAADEASLVVEDGPCALAECLVDLGKRLDRRRALVWLGVEGGGYRSGLGRRVQRLLQLDGAAWRPVTWTAKLVLLVSPCVVAVLTVAVSAWASPQDGGQPSVVALVEQALASGDPGEPTTGSPRTVGDNGARGPANQPKVAAKATSDAEQRENSLVKQLLREAAGLKHKLQKAAGDLEAYREKIGAVSPGDPRNDAVEKLNELSKGASAAAEARFKAESHYAQVKAVGTNVQALLVLPVVASDSEVIETQALLNKLEDEFVNVRQRYTPKHPIYVQVASELEDSRKALTNAVLRVPVKLIASAEAAKAAQEKFGNALKTQDAEVLELYRRSTEVEAYRHIYEAVLKQLKASAEGNEVKPSNPLAAPATNTLTGVLMDPQFRGVVRALEQRDGVRSFAAPDLTTQRNAEPKVVGGNVVADSAVPAAERPSPPNSASPAAADPARAPAPTPPQVNIQTKFAEVSASDGRALNFDWFLGNFLMSGRQTGVPSGTTGTNGTGTVFTAPAPISIPVTNASGVGTLTTGIRTDAQFGYVVSALQSVPGGTWQELRGDQFDWPGRAATNARNIRVTAGLVPDLPRILTAPQCRIVVHALEQRAGTEILTVPAVTTLSGREAQVRADQLRTVRTGINPEVIVQPGTKAKDGPKSPTFFSASLACGPELDVVPLVLPDGRTVDLTINANVTEFLGYDPPKRGDQVRVWQDGRRKLVARPTPRVRFRRMQGQARVFDGQTLVLVGPVMENRRLLVFVTPTIVDPAGNRVHSDDQLPSQGNAVPPQK